VSGTTHTQSEIATQPECWGTAATLAREATDLPRRGERVAVVGCGTSWFMAKAYAALREQSGHGRTDHFSASEMPLDRDYDRVVAITRSGTTTEVIDLVRRLGRATVAITATHDTPIHEVAERLIVLDFADEASVVQTRFATSALALLRVHLGQDIHQVIADAERALVEPLPPSLEQREQFTFLGRGWTVGLADEAALKLREASQSWTESYPAMEYRHGPASITSARSAVWFFGEPPPGLVAEVERIGALAVTSDLDPMADLVRAQRLAVALSLAKGLDPDRPRNLERSVVLEQSHV
jgi:fructoselysine-6-P-deglycase FrlB-like protein